MQGKPNILVVCGRNKRRSRTAEYIFKNDMRFNIRSVGLSPKSDRVLQRRDLEWAELILVMQQGQRARLRSTYKEVVMPEIEVLQIADIYEYLDQELVRILTEKINAILNMRFDL